MAKKSEKSPEKEDLAKASVLSRVAKESGKTLKELKALVDEKKDKFSGMLTDEGAAFLVAKELGVEIEEEKKFGASMKLGELEEGLQGVDLLVRVMQVYPVQSFERDGETRKRLALQVGDETGEMRLTLWGGEAERHQDVERGAVLAIHNAGVRVYKENKELSLGYQGSVDVNPEGVDAAHLPMPKRNVCKVKALKEGAQGVEVVGRVVRVFEKRAFNREGETRHVTNFIFGDETGTVRVAAWGEHAHAAEKLASGTVLKIEGAYVKPGYKEGVELNMGFASRMLVDPKLDAPAPEVKELKGREYKQVQLDKIAEGDAVALRALVVGVQKGNLYYLQCPECRGKVSEEGGTMTCEKCGEVKGNKRWVVTANLDDGSAVVPCTFFGAQAEQLFGAGREKLEEMLQTRSGAEALGELGSGVVGKEIKVQGRVRKNDYRDEQDVVCDALVAVNAGAEAKKVLS